MAKLRTGTVPDGPIDIETIIETFPRLRQSLLSKLNDCPLSLLMEIKYSNGWSTHPQARGTIFHRFAEKCIALMVETGVNSLPVDLADPILLEALRQEDVDPRDIVRVPLQSMPELRMSARKFLRDNNFTVERIVKTEGRLSAIVEYPDPRDHGGVVRREITGQIDLLMHVPPDGAVVVDWKDTWMLPPERRDGSKDGEEQLSYLGYFQQRIYAWLIFKNFPSVNRVTLREFYVRRSEPRRATVTRKQMPELEQEVSMLAHDFDAAFLQGPPPWPYGWWPKVDRETGEMIEGERELDIGRLGRWTPQPGEHCAFCARARDCPVDSDTRIERGAPPTTERQARQMAAELQVIETVKKRLVPSLKAWVETRAPIPVRSSKGRRMLGWIKNANGNGRTFKLYTPDLSERERDDDLDERLADAQKFATARARSHGQPKHGDERRRERI